MVTVNNNDFDRSGSEPGNQPWSGSSANGAMCQPLPQRKSHSRSPCSQV